jgi:FixJ family two-component response regulator
MKANGITGSGEAPAAAGSPGREADSSWIAVVDDDPAVGASLRRFLVVHGLRARAFGSGREFLDACAVGPPACAVVDIHMPGLSGFAVQEQLAARPAPVPVLLISATDSEETMAQVRRAHLAFLHKPFDPQCLLRWVERAALGAASGHDACRQPSLA